MFYPGYTVLDILVLDQTPDATPIIRAFRNGVRAGTAVVTGSLGSYTWSFLVPTGWATGDIIQIIAYSLFGGTQYTTQLYAGRVVSNIKEGDSSISVALVMDRVPDATPAAISYVDGVVDGTSVVTAGFDTKEFTVTYPPNTAGLLRINAYSVIATQAFSATIFGAEVDEAEIPSPIEGGVQHSPAEIIQQLLIDLSLTSDPEDNDSWPVYSTGSTDGPDNAVFVTDTTGLYDGRHMKGGKAYFHFGIQIMLRATSHPVGLAKIRQILTTLTESVVRQVVTLDTVMYMVHAITRPGQILPLTREDPMSSRNMFSLNFTTPIRKIV